MEDPVQAEAELILSNLRMHASRDEDLIDLQVGEIAELGDRLVFLDNHYNDKMLEEDEVMKLYKERFKRPLRYTSHHYN